MKIYVLGKSKAELKRRLAAGERITGRNYSMFGGAGIYALDESLPDGTLIAVYEKMMDGNPISKSFGTWRNGAIQ
jgi:hypothetical protein